MARRLRRLVETSSDRPEPGRGQGAPHGATQGGHPRAPVSSPASLAAAGGRVDRLAGWPGRRCAPLHWCEHHAAISRAWGSPAGLVALDLEGPRSLAM